MDKDKFFSIITELKDKSFKGRVFRETRPTDVEIAYEPLRSQYQEAVRMTITNIRHPELPSYLRFERSKIYGGDEVQKEEIEIDDEPDLLTFQLLDPRIYLHLHSKGDFWIETMHEEAAGLWHVKCKYILDSSYLNLDKEFIKWFSEQADLKCDVAFSGRAQTLEEIEQSDLPPYQLERILLRLE